MVWGPIALGIGAYFSGKERRKAQESQNRMQEARNRQITSMYDQERARQTTPETTEQGRQFTNMATQAGKTSGDLFQQLGTYKPGVNLPSGFTPGEAQNVREREMANLQSSVIDPAINKATLRTRQQGTPGASNMGGPGSAIDQTIRQLVGLKGLQDPTGLDLYAGERKAQLGDISQAAGISSRAAALNNPITAASQRLTTGAATALGGMPAPNVPVDTTGQDLMATLGNVANAQRAQEQQDIQNQMWRQYYNLAANRGAGNVANPLLQKRGLDIVPGSSTPYNLNFG